MGNGGMIMKILFTDFLSMVIRANHFNRSVMLRSYKIIYYKSGSGQTMIGSSLFRFAEGMFAVVGPDEIFEDIVTSQTEEMICEFVTDSDGRKIQSGLYYDKDNVILKQFEKIQREYRGEENYRSECLDLFSAELYYLVLRNLNKYSEKANTIQDIVKYIDEFFYDDIKIELLAKKTGYTCRHFRSLFTEKVGISPSEYLLEKRLENSRNLLLTTSQSIVEISQSCGFSSASQFAMLFKRYTGMTPSEYRNSVGTA